MNDNVVNVRIDDMKENALVLKNVSKDLRVIFDDMDEIINRLRITDGWKGDSADRYYEIYDTISKGFPNFVRNVFVFATNIEESTNLYEKLNKKYENK